MTSIALQPGGSTPASLDIQSELAIPTLVAQVYESAPAAERCHLVETLLRPLGVLSLVAIANGIFAKIRFRNAGQELNVRVDDLQNVHAADMVALVHHAQQVSVETVDSLVHLLTSSGGLAGSAAAALLIGLLVQRARSRRSTQAQADDSSLDPC
ncbi:hypothetical protein [Variovorax sp. PAMC26660]|uniref:hypothetical protein n=1 Tax=Variovorax sp. PAMC26660 TaxID=2762322 RepID=UPI00164E4652|nr:hypothetical protein [Variovorax sp. PAMC26660]QNK67203.1 hypothetical protein H7F35_29285 [Variovorax sp. PAMC26660]